MSAPLDKSIYCSPFLDVASLDAILSVPDDGSASTTAEAVLNLSSLYPSGDTVVTASETFATTHAAIAQLSPKQRAVIWGHYFEGFTLRRIAQDENVSESAITQRKLSALARLKTLLSPQLLETFA